MLVSGTAPIDPSTGKLVQGTVEAQFAQCLQNISAILNEAGSSLSQTVSATLIVAEEEDFAAVSEEWSKWFKVDPPARQGRRCQSAFPA